MGSSSNFPLGYRRGAFKTFKYLPQEAQLFFKQDLIGLRGKREYKHGFSCPPRFTSHLFVPIPCHIKGDGLMVYSTKSRPSQVSYRLFNADREQQGDPITLLVSSMRTAWTSDEMEILYGKK